MTGLKAPLELRSTLETMKSAKAKGVNMNIWDNDIKAVEEAVETIEALRATPAQGVTDKMRSALVSCQRIIERDFPNGQLAIDIREALSAPAVEQPTAWMVTWSDGDVSFSRSRTEPTKHTSVTPLYAAPPAEQSKGKLLPCPFCGAQPTSKWYGGGENDDCGYWGIDCCGAFCHQDDEETAARIWNTRTSSWRSPAVIDRNAVIEECAKVLDDAAQDWNRIRDPGMANNARSYAKKIRALAGNSQPGTTDERLDRTLDDNERLRTEIERLRDLDIMHEAAQKLLAAERDALLDRVEELKTCLHDFVFKEAVCDQTIERAKRLVSEGDGK